MKARAPGGNWAVQNFDKLALVLALIALIVSSFLLVAKVGQQKAMSGTVSTPQNAGPQKPFQPTDISSFEKNLASLNQPFQVPASTKSLAVSELRVSCVVCGKPIPYDAMVCPFDGAPQPGKDTDQDSDGDGIPDKAEKAMGLNPADPNDAKADADMDGFTNLEEYKAGTDINDPNSRPTSVAKLRLLRSIVEPFRLRFLGVTKAPGGDRYQLNVRTLDRTYFAKMGEVVEGFTLTNLETNQAQLTLVLSRGDRTIRLVQGRIINEDALSALLVLLLDGKNYRVGINTVVTLPDKSYKVVDIKRDRVVVRDEESGADVQVVPLSEEERVVLQSMGGHAIR